MDDKIGGIGQTADEDKFLRMWMHQVMLCTVRGFVACFPQVRAEKLLLVAVMTFGQLLTELYAGDDLSVDRFRKTARDIFDEITKKAPVTAMPGADIPKTADTASVSFKSQ